MSQRRNKTKSPTRSPLVLTVMFLLLIGAGVVDGVVSHRWSPSDDLQLATDALQYVPETIGDWDSVEEKLDDRTMRVAAATGAVKRVFTNRNTQDWISVTIMCGPHGPISLHPPTVCFTGAGWDLETDPEKADVAFGQDSTCQFWQAEFATTDRTKFQKIVTNWGWNNGSGWKANSNPRFEYAGSPYLFKLYFTSSADLARDEKKDLRDEFMRQFLDEFDRTVMTPLQTTTTSRTEKL